LVELVKRWMKENQVEERTDPESVFSRWRDVVGDEIADHTRVVDARQGELVVEVDSAPLLNELSTYYSKEILESLKEHEEFRGIQKLRFRSGSF
jgi:predicted nucleic acid-binding Zn ribbon protein